MSCSWKASSCRSEHSAALQCSFLFDAVSHGSVSIWDFECGVGNR